MNSSEPQPSSPSLPPAFPHMLHGGDYNPEQWADVPGIWDQDLRLMNLAGINVATLGVFSWASLEPEEGVFAFEWLDTILDKLAANGQRVILATPSGAKPNWLALRYEEVRRCDPNGRREPQEGRHNFCWTSPVYREKVGIINTKLAERYATHPALLMWHLSNEYGNAPFNYCYCPLCFAAFREWLEARYGTPQRMTGAFWARFWSHNFTSFDQVTTIDKSVHGLKLAWRRFMTGRLVAFIKHESEPLRRLAPTIPITTNFMGTFQPFDYWQVAKELDIVSWDAYPEWHSDARDEDVAVRTAFTHDIYRAMKGGQPWLLMESTPSQTNWQRVSRLKRPGMHRLASLQAVAHGSDAVMYFQFRKSRGSMEKFHGAVVDHVGTEHTRVFRDVAQVGADLAKLHDVVGARTTAEVAIVYDWQNAWGIASAAMPRNADKQYLETCVAHYRPLWQRGVAVDVIDSVQDFGRYKLLIAPMLYMLRPGVAERIEQFVANGGTFVTTYLAGQVDEEDLCFLGGFPGAALRNVMGIWAEETDTLDDGQSQIVRPTAANPLKLPSEVVARHFCDIVHLEGAEALAIYGNDFYAGSPAITLHRYGQGRAYYIASRNDDAGTDAFVASLIDDLKIAGGVTAPMPNGVTVQTRVNGERAYRFAMNFTGVPQAITLPPGRYCDVLNDQACGAEIDLPPFGVRVMVAVD